MVARCPPNLACEVPHWHRSPICDEEGLSVNLWTINIWVVDFCEKSFSSKDVSESCVLAGCTVGFCGVVSYLDAMFAFFHYLHHCGYRLTVSLSIHGAYTEASGQKRFAIMILN